MQFLDTKYMKVLGAGLAVAILSATLIVAVLGGGLLYSDIAKTAVSDEGKEGLAQNNSVEWNSLADEVQSLPSNTENDGYSHNPPEEMAKAPLEGGSFDETSISEGDVWLLAQVIHAEGRGEPFQGQVAIGAVLLNRLRDQRFPDSLTNIVYEPGAFCTVADGQIYLTPDASAIEAARLAAGGWDPTGGAIYFYNPARSTSRWIFTRPVVNRIGRHVFAL